MASSPQDHTKTLDRAKQALNDESMLTLRDTLCALHDLKKRHVRLCHPSWTLDVRLDVEGKPEAMTHWSVPVQQRKAVLDALEVALGVASDEEVSLLDLLTHLQQQPYGQPVLRCLLPLRVRQGHAQGRRSHDRSHLHLVR